MSIVTKPSPISATAEHLSTSCLNVFSRRLSSSRTGGKLVHTARGYCKEISSISLTPALWAYCYRQRGLCVCRSVCLSGSSALQIGWTHRDFVWDLDSGGPSEPLLDVVQISSAKG